MRKTKEIIILIIKKGKTRQFLELQDREIFSVKLHVPILDVL